MTDSIVVKRLVRNLRYKLTYVKIFEAYQETNPTPEVLELLGALIEAQQSAIAILSSYLRGLDANIQDLELDERLMGHAFNRDSLRSRLRFIHDGLTRAVAWYRTQLMDRQMTADPELGHLLLELGEIDAAKLWRTESIMGMLRVSVKLDEKTWDAQSQPEPKQADAWRPRLVEDMGRPAWGGSRSKRWPRPSQSRRKS